MDFNALKRLPPWEWPKNAGEILLRVALDKNSPGDDRLLAVELAGDCTVIDDSMCMELINILCDPNESESLRAKAAISLGPILEYMAILDFEEDEASISKPMFDRIQETLRSTHENRNAPKEVRRNCLEASVRSPMSWHSEAVRAAYSSGDEEDKITSVFCMGYVDGFQDELNEAMEDKIPSIRNEALKALGNWQEGEPWFDLDDPVAPNFQGDAGMEALLRLSGMKAPNLSGSFKTWKPPLGVEFESNDDMLDELFRTLTLSDMPWDDELMDDDSDEDDEF